MSSLQIGIDLGTTNSLIAQFIDGETRLIPNKLGHGLTPSVVSVSEDGSILVGLAARERLATAPLLHLSALWAAIKFLNWANNNSVRKSFLH